MPRDAERQPLPLMPPPNELITPPRRAPRRQLMRDMSRQLEIPEPKCSDASAAASASYAALPADAAAFDAIYADAD